MSASSDTTVDSAVIPYITEHRVYGYTRGEHSIAVDVTVAIAKGQLMTLWSIKQGFNGEFGMSSGGTKSGDVAHVLEHAGFPAMNEIEATDAMEQARIDYQASLAQARETLGEIHHA